MIVGEGSGFRGGTGAAAERGGAPKYDPIVVSAESTVVSEYEGEASSDTGYQSEAELEASFIHLLESQAYEYLPITSEAELIANLRLQLEKVNDMTFSDAEWERFFSSCVASKNDGIVEKTVRIQEDHIQLLRRDDGSTKNVKLLDKKNIHNNRLQVINQYEVGRAAPGDGSDLGDATPTATTSPSSSTDCQWFTLN